MNVRQWKVFQAAKSKWEGLNPYTRVLAIVYAVLLVAFLLIAWLAPNARADNVDELQSRDVVEYCETVSDWYAFGLKARNEGAAREVKPLSRAQMAIISEAVSHGMRPMIPVDAIYVDPDWDTYTLNEREFMTKFLLEGWDAADAVIQVFKNSHPDADNVSISPADIDSMAVKYMNNCAYQRAKERVEGFHKTASSQALVSPFLTRSFACMTRLIYAQEAIYNVRRGLPLPTTPESWSEEERARVDGIILGAIGWPRGEQDYVDYVRLECAK